MAKTKGDRTHLMYQSKRDQFRRAGILATKTPQVIAIDALTEDQLKAIEAQKDEIVSSRITADEARLVRDGKAGEDGRSKAELITIISNQNEAIAKMSAELAAYKQAVQGDLPPKKGTQVEGAGNTNPLPTPGSEQSNKLPSL